MKIEAKFYSENNKIYFLDGKEVELKNIIDIKETEVLNNFEIKSESFYLISISWTSIGKDEDNYNEEFLANLREVLKSFEDKSSYAIIKAQIDSENLNEIEKQNAVASFKHCARRIKDCENVIGFSIPSQVDANFFIEELKQKHKQYILFSNDFNLLNVNKEIVNL